MELGERDQPAGRSFALAAASTIDEIQHASEPIGGLVPNPPDVIHRYWLALQRFQVLLDAGENVFSSDMAQTASAWAKQQLDRMVELIDIGTALQVVEARITKLSIPLRSDADLIYARLDDLRRAEWLKVVSAGGIGLDDTSREQIRKLGSVYRVGGGELGPAHLGAACTVVGAEMDKIWHGALIIAERTHEPILAADVTTAWQKLRRQIAAMRHLLVLFGSDDVRPKKVEGRFERLAELLDEQHALVVSSDLVHHSGLEIGDGAAVAAGALIDPMFRRIDRLSKRASKRWNRLVHAMEPS